jgi:hypothetical protein
MGQAPSPGGPLPVPGHRFRPGWHPGRACYLMSLGDRIDPGDV